MRALLEQVDVPAVDALLTSVDKVMNSNTLLLRARADAPITPDNRLSVLEAFLHSPLFADMMRAADLTRHWGNLQSGPLAPDWAALELAELGTAGLRERLSWMLQESFSPYRSHLDAEDARAVVDGFLAWLNHDGEGWSCWSVRPDFLYSTGSYTNELPLSDAAYFDGGCSDTATYLYRGDILMLLLTNGCP